MTKETEMIKENKRNNKLVNLKIMRLSCVLFDLMFWVLVLVFILRVVIFVLFTISCDIYEAAFSTKYKRNSLLERCPLLLYIIKNKCHEFFCKNLQIFILFHLINELIRCESGAV